jgi:hypothetical protein
MEVGSPETPAATSETSAEQPAGPPGIRRARSALRSRAGGQHGDAGGHLREVVEADQLVHARLVGGGLGLRSVDGRGSGGSANTRSPIVAPAIGEAREA